MADFWVLNLPKLISHKIRENAQIFSTCFFLSTRLTASTLFLTILTICRSFFAKSSDLNRNLARHSLSHGQGWQKIFLAEFKDLKAEFILPKLPKLHFQSIFGRQNCNFSKIGIFMILGSHQITRIEISAPQIWPYFQKFDIFHRTVYIESTG